MDPVIPRTARRRGAARLRGLLLLALCWATMTGAVFGGCKGLFTPATPEPPTTPPVIPNYRSPELTLRTLEDAIAAKERGSEAWSGAFADSSGPGIPMFHHFFDPTDVSAFKASCPSCSVPTDWAWGQENLFFPQFILSVLPSYGFRLELQTVVSNPDPTPGEDEAILHRFYQVYANSPDGNTTQLICTGYCDLIVTKVAGDRWLIRKWDDHRDPAADPTDGYQLSFGRRRLEALSQ